MMHHIQRRHDSALRCPRGEDFQVCCADGNCPDCSCDCINVDQLQRENIASVTAQNVICQIPGEEEEEVLTRAFGHAEFSKIDKTRFGPKKSKLYNLHI